MDERREPLDAYRPRDRDAAANEDAVVYPYIYFVADDDSSGLAAATWLASRLVS